VAFLYGRAGRLTAKNGAFRPGQFSVKPRLGGVERASVKVPTVRGFIHINATARGAAVAVGVPCNARATLCALAPAGAAVGHLALDGEVLTADAFRLDGRHGCVDGLGCGAAGRPRTLAWV
jgi:hypothetical protein